MTRSMVGADVFQSAMSLSAALYEEASQHFRPERTAELLVKIYGELIKS